MDSRTEEALRELHAIVDGIDADEIEREDGWWETSSAWSFGAQKLAELEALVTRLTTAPPTPRERNVSQVRLYDEHGTLVQFWRF